MNGLLTRVAGLPSVVPRGLPLSECAYPYGVRRRAGMPPTHRQAAPPVQPRPARTAPAGRSTPGDPRVRGRSPAAACGRCRQAYWLRHGLLVELPLMSDGPVVVTD